jgi:hypothetical protein
MISKEAMEEEGSDLPSNCWQNVLQHLTADELARAAAINRACRYTVLDDRLWSPHFVRAWSPEHCVIPPSHVESS